MKVVKSLKYMGFMVGDGLACAGPQLTACLYDRRMSGQVWECQCLEVLLRRIRLFNVGGCKNAGMLEWYKTTAP